MNVPDENLTAKTVATESVRPPSRYPFSDRGPELLADFVTRMSAKDVDVVFTFAGALETNGPTMKIVNAFIKDVGEIGGTLLDIPGRGRIPAEMMYDTIFHATSVGASLFSAQIIAALCDDVDNFDLTCDADRVG